MQPSQTPGVAFCFHGEAPLDEPVPAALEPRADLRIRDLIRDMLLYRRGCEITELIAAERANNIAMAIAGEFELQPRRDAE